jgi:hypothetical protein
MQAGYKEISEKSMKILIPFATSHLCETGFSAIAMVKCKYLSQINVEHKIKVPASKIKPTFKKLYSTRQAHPSH